MSDLISREAALFSLHNDVGLGTANPAYKCIEALPAVQPDAGAIREASASNAPAWYSAWQADAWASGYNAARALIDNPGKEVMPSEDQKPNITKSDTAPAGLSAGGGAEPQMRMCRVCNQPDSRYARCLRPDCPDGRPAPATDGGA